MAMQVRQGWTSKSTAGIISKDQVWCAVSDVLIRAQFKYERGFGNVVLTIESSTDGVLHTQCFPATTIMSSGSFERELNVHGVGPLTIRSQWRWHPLQFSLNPHRPEQVSFLHEGRLLYSCHFSANERCSPPSTAPPAPAVQVAASNYSFEVLQVSTQHLLALHTTAIYRC
jgi:hypothetical protein